MLGAHDRPERLANGTRIDHRSVGDKGTQCDDADQPVVAGGSREAGTGRFDDLDLIGRRKLDHAPIDDEQATRGHGASISLQGGSGQGDDRIGVVAETFPLGVLVDRARAVAQP